MIKRLTTASSSTTNVVFDIAYAPNSGNVADSVNYRHRSASTRETCIYPGGQMMRHPGNAELPHCLRVDDNKLTPCSLAKMLKVRLRRNLIRSN